MRWLVTALLLLLVAAGGAWLAVGDRVAPSAGKPDAAPSAAVAALDGIQPDKVRRVDLAPPGKPAISLARTPDGGWAQDGNWPVRDAEAAALVNALSGLRTRFAPVTPDDPAAYGFGPGQDAVTAVVHTADKAVTLKFGRPPARPGESPFARPSFVKVDDHPELVRLGPDVYPVVARDPEVYRRRQLFPDAERVKLVGGEPPADPLRPAPASAGRVAVLGDKFTAVRVEPGDSARPGYTLRRVGDTPTPRRPADAAGGEPSVSAAALAGAWELEAAGKDGKPAVRDRVDPTKLRGVLTGLADLWAEKFLDATPEASGLTTPDYTVTVTRADGRPVVLRVGKVSRTVAKADQPPPASPFAPPPPPAKVTVEEFRFARLDGNDLVFEVRSDKLTDLLAAAADLRDAAVARFESNEVEAVTVARPGQPPVALTRKPGNKRAERDEDRQDRWYVGDLLAEPGKVTELLDALAKLEAKGDDRLDHPDAARLKELGLDGDTTTVTVTARAKVADGETPPPGRTYTFQLGKADADKKKLAVRLAALPGRVNLVDDAVAKLVDRPALAYRGRRLFDTADARLETVAVKKADGTAFALARGPKPGGKPGETAWALTDPVKTAADDGKADVLAGDLSRLEASEYVDDSPKADDLDKKYGLGRPRFAVDLGFAGPGGKPQKLEVGAARDGKPEAFARLNGTGSVFAVPNAVVDQLEKGSLALLPPDVWTTTSDRVTAVEIRRGAAAQNEAYRLAKDGNDWTLSGPLDAPVGFGEVQPLLTAVASVKADRYEAHAAADPAKYGFDKPALRLTVSFTEPKGGADVPAARTLVVGKPTADGATTRFARLDGPGGGAVFVVPDAVAAAADRPALGWLDKTILSLDPARVTKVQIAGANAAGNVTLVRGDDGRWQADGAAFAVDRPTVEGLVFAAARPRVARLAGYGSAVNWSQYGLAAPTQTVTLTLKPLTANGPAETHTLKLGKTESSGERYVRADDGPAVGVLEKAAADELAKSKLDFVDRTLFSFDPTALTGLTRTRGKEEFELTQGGLNWEIVKPAKQKADQPTAEELADQLARLRAVRVAAFAPSDAELAKFGLKDPAAVVTLKVGGDKPADRVLKLGKPADDKNPAAGRYVVAVPADPKAAVAVAVVAAPLADRLLADPIKFRDKTLAKFVDADRLTVERGDRKATFAKVNGTWKLTAPADAEAEQGELDELVNAAARLRADELAADKPTDLKPFGLDQPEAKLAFFAGDKKVLGLAVGVVEKDGPRVFVRADGSDVVARLSDADGKKLLAEYRRREVWKDLDASVMSSLAVSGPNGNFVLQKGPDGNWAFKDKPADPVDQAKVTETLGALATLKAERYAADVNGKLELYGLKEPKRVIVVTQRNGVTKTLQVGGEAAGSGGKRVYARVDEPGRTDVFVIGPDQTPAVTRDRAGFAGKK